MRSDTWYENGTIILIGVTSELIFWRLSLVASVCGDFRCPNRILKVTFINWDRNISVNDFQMAQKAKSLISVTIVTPIARNAFRTGRSADIGLDSHSIHPCGVLVSFWSGWIAPKRVFRNRCDTCHSSFGTRKHTKRWLVKKSFKSYGGNMIS